MAIGSKLGKVFGAIGSGLSFIPGPWSALGIAFSAASTAAEGVGSAKEAADAEREQQLKATTQQQANPTDPANGERPQARQIDGMAEQAASPLTPPPIFRQGKPNLGGYQLQIDQEIADMLIKDVGGLYGES